MIHLQHMTIMIYSLYDTSAAHDALPLLEVAADGDADGEEQEGQQDPNYNKVKIISSATYTSK